MISRSEATNAISEVDRIHRRTSLGSAYTKASPHLLTSGIIWTIGYVATGLTRPEQWALIWVPLALLGAAISFGFAYSSARSTDNDPAGRVIYASRLLWSSATMMMFIVSTFLLFQPHDPLPYLAFPALLMGFVYVLVGSFGFPRFRWIGVGIFALMIIGLLVGRDAIALWTASAGGGGLILGGIWLRKA